MSEDPEVPFDPTLLWISTLTFFSSKSVPDTDSIAGAYSNYDLGYYSYFYNLYSTSMKGARFAEMKSAISEGEYM